VRRVAILAAFGFGQAQVVMVRGQLKGVRQIHAEAFLLDSLGQNFGRPNENRWVLFLEQLIAGGFQNIVQLDLSAPDVDVRLRHGIHAVEKYRATRRLFVAVEYYRIQAGPRFEQAEWRELGAAVADQIDPTELAAHLGDGRRTG